MRELIFERIGNEEQCPYLAGERARMRYRLVKDCSVETYQRMLERGWRRFGTLFFRPGCAACRECRSLRVEVEGFSESRTMRRAWRKNVDLEVVLRRPTVSPEHLDLYARYHRDKHLVKGWPAKESEPFDYYLTFVEGHGEFGYELVYRLDKRLVMVALVDVLPRAVSAVYAFYDPALGRRSLGVYSILRQVELARRHKIPHLYLGYWVEGNASMRYKADYRPHQILAGRPEHNERPEWPSPGPEVGSRVKEEIRS